MSKLLYSEGKERKDGDPDRLSGTPGAAPSEGAADDAITITPAAAKEIQRQRDKRGTPDAVIRIGLRGGGCSGYSYVFDWADSGPRENDHVFSAHGATICVDPKSFRLLRGMELDFQSSLMGYGFKFNNPNAKSTCGCGESVQF